MKFPIMSILNSNAKYNFFVTLNKIKLCIYDLFFINKYKHNCKRWLNQTKAYAWIINLTFFFHMYNSFSFGRYKVPTVGYY